MNKLVITAAATLAAGFAAAQSTPVGVTGFNFDGIANGSDSSLAGVEASTTGTLDSIYVYFALGFDPSDTSVGVPSAVFTSADNSAVEFQFANPAGNNVLLLHTPGEGTSSGTLTLTTPEKFKTLSFMATGFNGSQPGTYTLNFSNGTTATSTMTVQDNFYGSGAAISNLGRVSRLDGTFDSIESGNPEIYEMDISLTSAQQNLTVDSITFASTQTGTDAYKNIGIFGLSGTPAPEPASMLALGGAAALIARRRRRAGK